MPLLPPRLLALLDALHLRVPLRTAVFGIQTLPKRLYTPFVASKIRALESTKRTELSNSSRPIRVYFLAINKAQFVYQSIYDAMEKDPSFEPTILVCPEWVESGPDADERLRQYFTDKGMRISTQIDSQKLPDVVFFPNLDDRVFKGVIRLKKAYDKILCCSMFYSMGIDNSGSFYVYQPDFRFTWKQYVPCVFYKELASKHGWRNGRNVVCSGSPKSDTLFGISQDCLFWKDRSHAHKRIIWAPHWSVLVYGKMSNFDRYYRHFFEFAKSHPEIEIVLKPHPLLKPRLTDPAKKNRFRAEDPEYVEVDCLPTEREYDEFVRQWCSLPNANYMDSGDYNDLFSSSDTMILDSVSFMAEYLVTEKPMCFCVREPLDQLQDRLGFNEFGKDLQSAMTIAPEWENIERFIADIVSKGDDGLSSKRAEVVKKHLSVNKGHVGEFVALDIKRSLCR